MLLSEDGSQAMHVVFFKKANSVFKIKPFIGRQPSLENQQHIFFVSLSRVCDDALHSLNNETARPKDALGGAHPAAVRTLKIQDGDLKPEKHHVPECGIIVWIILADWRLQFLFIVAEWIFIHGCCL